MIKNKKTNLTNLLMLGIILVCLFICSVGTTNAWFTSSGHDKIIVTTKIGDLKVKIYQNSVAAANIIYSELENQTSQTPKYIQLTSVIAPDADVPLTLLIKNEDAGSCYVRFKFSAYACTQGTDVDLHCNIVSTQFTLNNGYYYLGSYASKTALTANQSATLMTAFNITETTFNSIKSCENIKIELIIEAQTVAF